MGRARELSELAAGYDSGGLFGFRNRIINGDMRIDQRNNGASGTAAVYTVDRWGYYQSQTSRFTWQQNAGSVTPPAGFTNYLGFTSSGANTPISSDFFIVAQPIEGFNTADFGWGTAGAQSVTLSFWVRSSLIGTHSGSLRNGTGARSHPFTFTVSASNTWELKTVTIPGDTTGTWNTTNSGGIVVGFNLGAGSTFQSTAGSWAAGNFTAASGSVNVVGTNGATFYITGVQLEKGSTATSFDYRPYGTELMLCQRYAVSTFPSGTAWAQNAGRTGSLEAIGAASARLCIQWQLPTTMRASPTITSYNPEAANSSWRNISAGNDAGATINTASNLGVSVITGSAASTDNRYVIHLSATAEL